MYDLAISGVSAFHRHVTALSQRKVSRDPLSGVVDLVNRVFYTTYSPIVTSGSLAVYSQGGTLLGGVADFDTGEITLTDPPIDQPVATYMFTPYTAQQVMKIVISGFYDMESRWQRGYRLVDSVGSPADETSANVFLVDSSGSTPVCGGVDFDRSSVQLSLLYLCIESAFLRIQMGDSAASDYSYNESRGIKIDKSKRPENLISAYRTLEQRIERALAEAQDAQYSDGAHYGGYISGPYTDDYMANFEWQQTVKARGSGVSIGYNIPYRTIP